MGKLRIGFESNDPLLHQLLVTIALEPESQFEIRASSGDRNDRPESDFQLIHITNDEDLAAAHSRLVGATADRATSKLACILDLSDPRAELALLRAGAWDVFTRPLNKNRLSLVLQQLALTRQSSVPSSQEDTHRPTRNGNRSPRIISLPDLQKQAFERGILFRGERMMRLMDNLRPVINRDSTILISGETGTGKTQLARLVHDLSPRREEPFVVANCAALTQSLLESELFGHVRGAFTGATEARDGKFHAAGAGTLFLDEIDSLPPAGQQRLLRVLDQRAFEKVGGNTTETMRARVIAAANRPLEDLVAKGQFRSDLYYRLKVVALELPALRWRREDIAPIARHLAREEASRDGDPVPELSDDLLEHLSGHEWPGNIRELRNVISQMVVYSGGRRLSIASLPEDFRGSSTDPLEAFPTFDSPDTDKNRCTAPVDGRPLGHFSLPVDNGPLTSMRPLARERALGEAGRILRELQRHNHNRTKTAASLGISRNALYKKLKKLSLSGLL